MFANRCNLLALICPPDLLLISQPLYVILATGFPFTPVGDEATTFAFYLFSAALQFLSAKSVKQFSCFISITQCTLLLLSLLWVPRTALQKKLKPMRGLVSCCPRISLWVWQHISPNLPSSELEKQHHAGMRLHWSRNRPLWGSKCKRCVPSWYAFQYIIPKAVSHLSLLPEVSGLNSNGFKYIWKRLEDQRKNIFNQQNIYYCLLFLKWAPETIRLFVLESTQSHKKKADCFLLLQFQCSQCALFWYIGSWELYCILYHVKILLFLMKLSPKQF